MSVSTAISKLFKYSCKKFMHIKILHIFYTCIYICTHKIHVHLLKVWQLGLPVVEFKPATGVPTFCKTIYCWGEFPLFSCFCLLRENYPHVKIKPICLYEWNRSSVVKIIPHERSCQHLAKFSPKMTTFTVDHSLYATFFLFLTRMLICILSPLYLILICSGPLITRYTRSVYVRVFCSFAKASCKLLTNSINYYTCTCKAKIY